MKRELFIKEIIEEFSILRNRIELLSEVNLQDINVVSEYHIQEILNIILDLKLSNSNSNRKNQTAIDLQDEINRIAVQVTATSRKVKIQETLNKFFESNLEENYDTLIIFILGKKQKSYPNLKIKDGFVFNPEDHIFDFSKIVSRFSLMPTSKLEKIRNILKNDKIKLQTKNNSKKQLFKKNQSIRKKIIKSFIGTYNPTDEPLISYYNPPYKFFCDEFIIRSIEDKCYPDFDDPVTGERADWYKVFAFDVKEFYLEVRIMYSVEIVINDKLEWNYLNDREKGNFDKSLKFGKVDVLERIPFENIVDIEMDGEYPTIFVEFKDGNAYFEQIPFIPGYYINDRDCRATYYFETAKQNLDL